MIREFMSNNKYFFSFSVFFFLGTIIVFFPLPQLQNGTNGKELES